MAAAQYRYNIKALTALVDLVGEVQATPTSNTLLRRLKDLTTGIILAAGSAVIGGVTVADGGDVAQGAVADVAATAGDTGTLSAKLRAISRDLIANIVLAAGTNLIGYIEQRTQKTETAFLAAVWPHEIAAAGTATMVGDSVAVDVSDVIVGDVLVTLEGDVANAAFDALVDAEFVVSYDGTDYDDGEYQTLSFEFDGASTTRRRSIPLNVSGADTIKIKTLVNNDASFALTTATVNLYLTKKV